MAKSPQQIIIEAFGLNDVRTYEYRAVVGGITAINTFSKSQIKKLPTPQQESIPDEPLFTSVLGTPVFDSLVISPGNYVDTTYGPISYPEIRLDNVLITLSQVHNVITTPIQGRDGEVIEYVSKMSMRINVKGGIFATSKTFNRRPVEDIANLKKVLNSNSAILIGISRFLNEWDISQFVILDKNIPQTMGGYNYQLFEFNAINDLPVILAQKQAV